MKAVVLDKFGGTDVLKVSEVERPTPGADEVLIEVRSMAVNHVDLLRRQGKLVGKNKNMRLGYDCCGVIVEVGAKVTKFVKLDLVCAVLEGDGYAEYVVARETMVVRAPRNIGWSRCAALPYAGTALMLSLVKSNPMRAGQTILIHGGAGCLGSLAVQFTKYFGLKVFVTVELKEHMEFCRELKADVCINNTLEKYSARVLDETDGLGVDYILDCSDRDNEEDVHRDIECLAKNGSLIFMGSQLGNLKFDLQIIAEKRIRLVGSYFRLFPNTSKEELLEFLEKKIWPAIENGDIVPKISKTFDLDEVQCAHKLMESKEHAGRIVMTTSHCPSL